MGAGLFLLLGFLLALAFWPDARRPFTYRPLRPRTYAEVTAEIRRRLATPPADVRPECRGQMLVHGRRTPRVFVLMHGLSNCPAQFGEFGKLLFRQGHNVLIPRLPFHGQSDRLTDDWKALTAQMMLDSANEAVDAARGLGDRITVVGLSVNAAAAAWVAQNRNDVEQVALLAPFLTPAGMPEWSMAPAARLIQRLPNRFLWWDPKKKASLSGGYAYPRFPTHAISQVMGIGMDVLESAQREAPRCGSVLLVTTGSDETANNELAQVLAARWKRHKGQAIAGYEFPREQRVGHDFIDPTQPNQQIDRVYPILLSLLKARREPPHASKKADHAIRTRK